MQAPRILLVTDVAYEEGRILEVIGAVSRAIGGPRFGVQLRDKTRNLGARASFAARVRQKTRDLDVPLIVNGDLELAHAVQADGVHLGVEAHARSNSVDTVRAIVGPSTWISVAARSDADAERALASGVDAVLVSPVFDTPGKGPPRGVAALRSARSIAGERLFIYALGGVRASVSRACREAGADGVAVIRALLGSEDPDVDARAMLAALKAPDT